MKRMDEEAQSYPLIGSIQNSVGMGFVGNQATFAVANGLGARPIHAQSMMATAHGGFGGRSSAIADPQQFRRDVAFVISQRPGIIRLLAQTRSRRHRRDAAARVQRRGEILLGSGDRTMTEHAYLNGLFDLGPEAVIVTSFERDPEKHRVKLLFTNGYSYYGIWGPLFPSYPAHGAGDVFAAGVATFAGLGGSPFAAALLSTALAARAVANTTPYGGATVDPVAALAKWSPAGYQNDDDRAIRFCKRSNVEAIPIKPTSQDGARLKIAPPKHKIIYG